MATSPTSGPGGGGGGGLTEQHAAYHGENVTIANGANARLTWQHLDAGTELFDHTDQARPAVLAAGVYIVSASVLVSGMTAAGSFAAQLFLDASGVDIELDAETGAAIDGTTQPNLTVSGAYYIPLGGTVEVIANNYDGVAARDFRISSATVIRLA